MAVLPRSVLTLMLLVSVIGFTASADAKKRVFGWIEKATIPDVGVMTKAKMDTGALTSSIHATNVERFRRDGEKWVRFTVELKDTKTDEVVIKTIERPFVRRLKVYGAGGEDSRVVVLMDVCIGNLLLQEQFGLTNRSDKNYGLLIGRRTIEHMGLVDVKKTFTTQPNCERPSKDDD